MPCESCHPFNDVVLRKTILTGLIRLIKKNWFFSGTHYVVCTVKLLSTVDKPEALCETQEFFRELNYFFREIHEKFLRVPKGAEPALDALQRAS